MVAVCILQIFITSTFKNLKSVHVLQCLRQKSYNK